MAQEIIQLQKEEEPEGNVHKNDLSGKKVAVIGGNKERYYRECVEKYNAEIIFVAEDQHRKIDSAVKKADVVFYLIELLSHIYHELIIPAAARYNTPIRFVNSKGITCFRCINFAHMNYFVSNIAIFFINSFNARKWVVFIADMNSYFSRYS